MDTFWEYAVTVLLTLLLIWNVYSVKICSLPGKSTSALLIAITIVIFIFLMPFVIMLLIIMVIYRNILHIILKIKHGNAYIGLVTGIDAVHTIDTPANSKTCILIIFEHDYTNSSKPFYDILREVFINYLNSDLKHLKKFDSEYRNYMGYTYMLRANLDPSECVKKMIPIEVTDDELNELELTTLLNNAYNSDLPRNNAIFWDILFGTYPIKWGTNANKNIKYYPVLLRNHHGLADGVALFKLLVGVLADKNTKIVSSDAYNGNFAPVRHNTKYDKTKLKNIVPTIFMKILNGLVIMALSPASIFVNTFLRANDNNCLHNSNLSGESVLMFHVDADDTYVKKIKKIKQKIPGTSFPEIVLTALSASFSDYFYKKSSSLPKYVTAAIPVVPGSSQLQYLEPGSLNVNEINFANNYSLILLNFPLCIRSSSTTPLTDRLRLLKNEINILSKSVDYQVNYILMRVVFSMFPQSVVKFLLRTFHCTSAVSIMPGSRPLSFGEGAVRAVDIGFWIPHIKNVGISFSALTFNGKLFIGLSVDKNMLISAEDGKNIISQIYQNIDLFEKELFTS